MDTAIEAILTQGMPIRTAAKLYYVSRNRLMRQLDIIKRHEIKEDIGERQDLMSSAVQAVQVDKLKIRTAAKIFGVPECSLLYFYPLIDDSTVTAIIVHLYTA